MKWNIFLLGLLVLGEMPAWAVPQALNFQGRLSEGGAPVTGRRDMTFRIFDTASGGVELYKETRFGGSGVNVSTGIFSVLIGELMPIPASLFDGRDKFIEVEIGNSPLPRQRIVSVGHAFLAAKAESLLNTANINVATISVASATVAGNMRITGLLTVGEGTIHMASAGGGVTNGITFTKTGAQPNPQIRTAESGMQNVAAPTGSLPLSINAGAGGSLRLNEFSTGPVLMSQNALSNTGIGTLAPTAKLQVAATAGTAGNVLVVSTGTTDMFRVLGTGEVIAARFTGDGSGLTNIAATDPSKVSKAGDGMTGPLTLVSSTLTVSGQDTAGFSMSLSSGLRTPVGTIEAGLFVGDGSGLTNVTGNDPGKVARAGDTMTGQLTLSGSTLTVTGKDSSGYSLSLSSGLSSPVGTIVGGLFVGDGSGLSNVTGTDPGKVAKAGDTMTGQLTLSGSTLTVTGQNAAGYSLSLSSGLNAPLGTITGGLFVGDGSGLSNVTGTDPGKVAKAGDTMTGQLTLSASTLTVTGRDASGYSLTLSSGLNAPAGTIAGGLFVGNGSGLSNVTGTDPTKVSKAGDTMTGTLTMNNVGINLTGAAGSVASQSSVTASAFFGNGADLTNLRAENISLGTATINITGKAGTAAALAANGANCAVGNAAAGVDSAGTAEGCFDIGTQAEVDTKVAKAGDTMTGSLSMSDAGINLTGPSGSIVSQASITASAFFGSGSSLTSLTAASIAPGTAAISVTGSAGSLASNGANCATGSAPLGVDASGAAEGCFDVGTQAEVDTKVSRTGDTMTGALNMSNASVSLAGPLGMIASQSSITASAFFGNGAGLTSLAPANISAGTAPISVTGNAATASGLAANAANCAPGSAALGVDESGSAEGCFDVGTQAEVDTKVSRTGDTMTGNLNMGNAGISLTGPLGSLTSQSSVTASAFFGSGASLASLTAANIAPGTAGISVTGSAASLASNGANCAVGSAPSGVDASGAAEGCFDVGTQAEVDTKVSKTGDSMTGALTMSNAGVSLAGPLGTIASQSSITASAFFGSGAGLNNLTAANISAGTAPISVTGNATTASGLAANAANCAAGSAASGVDAFGSAEGCFDVGTQAEVDTKVSKAGDTMTGTLSMANAGISMTGSSGTITSGSSITASAFFGDATGMTASVPTASGQLATKGYVDAAMGGGGGLSANFLAFSTAGTFGWTVPSGVTKIIVEVWGAGGNGSQSGGGGGGGGYGKGQFEVVPGTILSVTVGAGGQTHQTPTNDGVSKVVAGSTELLWGGKGSSVGPTEGTRVWAMGGGFSAPFGVRGQRGRTGTYVGATWVGGQGGNSYLNQYGGGDGATGPSPNDGRDGVQPGGGGGGGNWSSNSSEGDGADGAVLIWY